MVLWSPPWTMLAILPSIISDCSYIIYRALVGRSTLSTGQDEVDKLQSEETDVKIHFLESVRTGCCCFKSTGVPRVLDMGGVL